MEPMDESGFLIAVFVQLLGQEAGQLGADEGCGLANSYFKH